MCCYNSVENALFKMSWRKEPVPGLRYPLCCLPILVFPGLLECSHLFFSAYLNSSLPLGSAHIPTFWKGLSLTPSPLTSQNYCCPCLYISFAGNYMYSCSISMYFIYSNKLQAFRRQGDVF